MKIKEKNTMKKSKKSGICAIFYIAAAITAIVGIALLVNNVLLYKSMVTQYVAQGYTLAVVTKQLIPSQLLPGIFEPVGIYGGIAFLLLGVGIINNKISKYLVPSTKGEICNSIADVQNIEPAEETKNVEEAANHEKAANTEEIASTEEAGDVKKTDEAFESGK